MLTKNLNPPARITPSRNSTLTDWPAGSGLASVIAPTANVEFSPPPLVSAGAYFANTWREDNSEAEQTVLRAFATGDGDSVLTAEYQAALQSLSRKEMLERTEDGYRLAVPLFGRWIVKNQVAEALPEPLVRVA